MDQALSNERSRKRWEAWAVGSQRTAKPRGSQSYFEEMRAHRYGYETPFISRLFEFHKLAGRRVLEIGVGNGIDAVEMARHGAVYAGLDITKNHLDLTRRNFELNLPGYEPALIEGDLLDADVGRDFDVVYAFGVLHHIAHEESYLRRIHGLLKPDGTLRIAVYSKYSFFNAYLIATWLRRGRMRVPLLNWQSHVSEGTPLSEPVTIKIRSRRSAQKLLERTGFRVDRYYKRGFVQNYLPPLGKLLHPDGWILNSLGAALGWYHIFICSKAPQSDPQIRLSPLTQSQLLANQGPEHSELL